MVQLELGKLYKYTTPFYEPTAVCRLEETYHEDLGYAISSRTVAGCLKPNDLFVLLEVDHSTVIGVIKPRVVGRMKILCTSGTVGWVYHIPFTDIAEANNND